MSGDYGQKIIKNILNILRIINKGVTDVLLFITQGL